MKRIFVLLIIFSVSIFAQLEQDSNLTRGKLENGLEYFIYPNEKPKNFISVRLKVETGSIYEKEGEEGIAHFLEHMAFNGTKKYKSNDLIRELEKMGVAFGPELNAYTAFDETVYMLDGQSKDLEKFIDILHQWGFEMTLDPEEIEKEKGVVLEEWRQGTGVGKEQNEFYQKYLFRGSIYADRIPIGLVESIEAFNKEKVENYYKRWYSPNNMKLYIAGDINNVKEVEAFIKQYFSKENKIELEDKEEFKKRTFKKLNVKDSFINNELRDNQLSYINIIPFDNSINQLDELREGVVKLLFHNAIEKRYSKKLNSLNTNLNSLYLSKYNFNDYFSFDELNVDLKKDKELEGIEEAFAELNQIMKGIGKKELDNAKKYYKNYLNELLESIHNTETAYVIDNILYFDFDKDVFLSQEDEIKRMLVYIDEIELKDIDDYIAKYFGGIEKYYLYTGYKKLNEKEMKKSIKTGEKKDLGKYELNETKGELISKEPKKGKILTKEYIEDGHYYLLTLSNGSKVYLKDIDYEENSVVFGALSRGGFDYVSSEDLKYTDFIGSVIESGPGTMTREEYKEFLKNKNINMSYGISKDREYFYGSSTSKYPGDMLKAFYAFVSEPKLNENQLEIDKAGVIEGIKTKNNLSETKFWEELHYIINDYDERAQIMDIDDVEEIKGEKLLDIYKDRFCKGDYDYYIVGDINYDEIKPAIEKYLASIHREKTEDYEYIRQKQLDEDKVLVKNLANGKDTRVVILFGDDEPLGEDFDYYGSMVQNVLDTELTKTVREKLSGAYNIAAWADISKHDLTRGRIFVSFTCEPQRVDELVKAVRDTFKNVLNGNISDETISYIIESYKRDYDRLQGTNDYYINYFENLIYGDNQLLNPADYNKLVSKKNILKFLEKIYGDYEGDFILNPFDSEE